MKKQKVSGLKFIGGNRFLWGVPARDLTPDEVAVYGREWLISTGLYIEEEPENDGGEECQQPQ